MSLHYIYSDAPLSTIDLTGRCRVSENKPLKEQAEEGAVPISALVIDDPDGDLIMTGHRRLYIYEDTAPVDNQVIYNGFTANERVERGPSDRTGAARQWTVDLADANVLINRRIMNGADANRPAETDVERGLALLAMTELNTVTDSLYFSTASPVNMDAVDYRGQNVGAYLDDMRQASGKNAYIWYREATGQYSLWYDFVTSTAYDSGCFLSNTLSEIDFDTVFAYSQERTYIDFGPSRVASGIYLDFDNATDSPVYVQSATTLANFAAIDWAAPSVNVKTLAKATARANRYLADAGSETVVIHVVMTSVPRDKVNSVKNGQLVSFKATWGPGFEEYVVCRVLYRTVSEISEDPIAGFEIEMDLAPVDACPAATAAGFYASLGGPGPLGGSWANNSPADGVTQYFKAGDAVASQPPGNAAGWAVNNWHFPGWSTVDAGSPSGFSDGSGANIGNSIYLFLTGDGALEILSHGFQGTCYMNIFQVDAEPGAVPPGSTWESLPTTLASGITADSYLLQIRALHPAGGFPCSHLIRIDFEAGSLPADRNYRGCNWTPI